jgi:hypothetical protein
MPTTPRILAALSVLLAATLWPRTAIGPVLSTGPPCAMHTEIVRTFGSTFGETIVGRGLRGDGVVLELLVGPNGTWSIIITHPGGLSCLVSDGEAWEMTERHST